METVQDQSKMCGICRQSIGKYVCPRCNVVYCSLPCYRANVHLTCSESFYKECIEEELKLKNCDPEMKEEMKKILRRVENEEDNESLDSDDDELAPELAERLEGIDLDDADAVWDALTEEEKKDFTELLQKGDVSQILPAWTPWWRYREEKKLIEELGSSTSNSKSLMESCPNHLEDIPALSQICKKPPSGCVQFNLINVLYAYAYIAKYFAGDHQNFAMEAVHGLLMISCNLRNGNNYHSAETAIESAASEVNNCQWLSGTKEVKDETKTDVRCIIEGPKDEYINLYILSALSDTYNLIVKAKSESGKKIKGKTGFAKKFSDGSLFSLPSVPKSQLQAILKKVEYYLAWSKTYADDAFCM